MRTEEEVAGALAVADDLVVDTDRLIHNVRTRARARRRRRRTGAALGVAALVGAAVATPVLFSRTNSHPNPVATASTCTVQWLPSPPLGDHEVVSYPRMDRTGRYVVATIIGGRARSVVWDNAGQPQVLDGGQGVALYAADVNSHGWVAGNAVRTPQDPSAFDYDEDFWGWVWRDVPGDATPRMVRLPKPLGYPDPEVRAVNDSGQVTGTAHAVGLTTEGTNNYVAVVWDPDDNGGYTVRVLPGYQGQALDIGEDGTVIGYVDSVPWVWAPDGTGHAVPPPAADQEIGPEMLSVIGPEMISGDWAFGISYVWNLRTGEVRLVDAFGSSGVGAVNANGDLVYYDLGQSPVLVRAGERIALPVPPETPENDASHRRIRIVAPVALSEDSTVILGAADNLAWLWHC